MAGAAPADAATAAEAEGGVGGKTDPRGKRALFVGFLDVFGFENFEVLALTLPLPLTTLTRTRARARTQTRARARALTLAPCPDPSPLPDP